MDEGKRLDDREHSGQKKESQDPSKYRHHFQVKYIPKGLFQLFNKNETYIYEKKFSCELPKNITTPKSFHYPYSLENYCKADLLTMDFDLKKNPDILTDPKINTFIHQDFINNSLELIYPNLTTTTYKKRTDKEQNFKKKIIEIIERSEEVNQDNSQILNEIPDFLRRQTYLRPSTVVNIEKKPKAKEKAKPEKKQKTTLQDLIKSIEQSFNDIDKIKVGMKHPDPKKKGLTAKNVYEVSPMTDMPNIKFIEYLFPSEPSEVLNLNENFLAPDHFIITNNISNDINEENTNSLYINNKLKTQEDHTEKDRAEYYTYEKEFTATKMSQSDLFNKYFFILDKKNKKLKISPLSDKYTFRRYKKMTEGNLNLNNNNQNGEEGKEKPNEFLNKKRKKDLILVPSSMEKEELDGKKRWFKDRGYVAEFSERKIYEVDHTDAMEVEKERQKEEELKRQKSMDLDDGFLDDENEGEENDDNAFDDFGEDENDKGDDDEQKSNDDENDQEQNSNEENNDNDENEEDNKSRKGSNDDNESENKNEQSEKEDENNEHEDDKYFE